MTSVRRRCCCRFQLREDPELKATERTYAALINCFSTYTPGTPLASLSSTMVKYEPLRVYARAVEEQALNSMGYSSLGADSPDSLNGPDGPESSESSDSSESLHSPDSGGVR